MRQDEEDDERTYKVVVNDEEQFSIWFADRDNAPGWKDAGKSGSKADCLAYIDQVWTDMRPKSLRQRMDELGRQPPPEPAAPAPLRHPQGKNELVERLEKPQPVVAAVRGEPRIAELKRQFDRGYVFMRFVATGTELGIRVDRDACDLAAADFEKGTGKAKLVGDVKLNYNLTRYHGTIDLSTLEGEGRLEFVRELSPGG